MPYTNVWLNKTFKEKTILKVEYADDGKTLVFYFTDETQVVIRVSWSGALYALDE